VFEIRERDAAGRIGRLETAHGTITTPTVLPVVNPGHQDLPPVDIARLGAQAVITNSYIIHRTPRLRRRALEEGVHRLIGFPGPVMTDSGSFQMYEYGGRLDPLEIVAFQRDIGSDMGTILDVFSLDADRARAEREVAQTLERARDSAPLKGDMLLACTVQGGTYADLRLRCARELAGVEADLHPIGGVVPIMEQQGYGDLTAIIAAAKKGLPPHRPVHLFGAGHPLVFPLAVALGCDLFDSAAYAKYAQDGRLMLPEGTVRLAELEELPCACPVCSLHTAGELREMEPGERRAALARHNLHVTFVEMRRIREAIRGGWLWELVEQRARSHPRLLEALAVVQRKKRWLEQYEPVSKTRALLYTGRFSLHRPLIHRLHRRILDRYAFFFDRTLVVDEEGKPFTRRHPEWARLRANVLVRGPLGLIPLELEDMYPVAQSVFPETLDGPSRRVADSFSRRLLRRAPPVVGEAPGDAKDFDLRKIRAVADVQFGPGAGEALFSGEPEMVKSSATGKIRNVYCDRRHVASLRAGDGLFTLKLAGGQRLHAALPPPRLRVVLHPDAVPFVTEGKSVFAKFVVDADPQLRPYDEALIVDRQDGLVAVGQCRLNRQEMLAFDRGMAVKTREGGA